MRGRIFRHFFEDLAAGDPVALGILAVLALVALAVGIVWLKTARDLRREDEARKRRYGGGKKR
ncbi:MAG TPA: hypothetical protein VFE78_08780 [Gemmataceae bacterium]|jgi:hypothetical protein|nr:hypothetical protein [Gemmataceae bacterium]